MAPPAGGYTEHTMNRKLLAVALAATLGTAATSVFAPRPVRAQFIAPYGTGYQGANGLQYNNPMSATMSVMIQGMQQQSMLRSSLMSSYYARWGYGRARRGLSPAQLRIQRGRKIIKSGRATTRFKTRPAPAHLWVADWAKRNPKGRAGAEAEWREQSQIWRQAVAQRGATYGDMAELQSVAFVLCLEAYTGRQIADAGYRRDLPGARRAYLRSASYQGQTQTQKQAAYEDFLLKASWAMYLRRHGRMDEARKTAAEFINECWTSDHKGVPDVQDAVATYANFQAGPLDVPAARRVAEAPVTRAKPLPSRAVVPTRNAPDAPDAPDDKATDDAESGGANTAAAPRMTLAQVVSATNYSPVAPMVLPEMFARQLPQMDQKQREQMQRVCEKLLTGVRDDFAKNTKTPFPVHNVARAMTYALIQLYPLASAKSGQSLESAQHGPLTPQRIEAIRQQFALALASNPGFTQLSDREKQEMAEMLIVVPTMASVLYEAGREDKDESAMKEAQELARDTFGRTFGVAYDKVTFSDDKPDLG